MSVRDSDQELEKVFKALADPTRRKLLDELRNQPKTTGDLCGMFPELTRFGVMKHLGVLEEANLIFIRRDGRVRWNHLNPVPIQRIHERWISRFAAPLASTLLGLERHLEKEEDKKGDKS